MSIATDDARPYRGEAADMTVTDKVAVTVHLDKATADEQAAHKIERDAAGLDILADMAKPTMRKIMDALIAAGYGQ